MKYPDLQEVSKEYSISEDVLQNVFEFENEFYEKIIKENSFEKRQDLYKHVYNDVLDFFPKSEGVFERLVIAKTKVVKQFRKELNQSSLLDIGSGSGAFLYALAQSGIELKAIFGLDVKAAEYEKNDKNVEKINFFQQNILDFNLNRTFDVLLMDNVYEHIARSDQPFFFKGLKTAIHKGSKLIMILPHRMYGPTDFTRIIDNSHSGKTVAQCVHLNESTFSDVMNDLKAQGFGNFKTTIPFIAFQSLRTIFSNLRLPASWFAAYESSWLMRLMRKIRYKNRPLFRMEVIIIAEYLA